MLGGSEGVRVGCRVVIAARKIDDGFGWYCMVLVWWVVVRYVGLGTEANYCVFYFYGCVCCLSVRVLNAQILLHPSL